MLYVLFILIIILVAVYILFTIYRLKHEVSVEQQISDIKLRFFTNISHELRTPLTLIAGPVEQVLKNDKLPADAREQLVVVERNTNRMLRLVNQILDFRKIQNKKMKMQVQRVDIVPFVRKVMDNFEAVAEEHRIDFLFQTEKEHLYLWVDADKLEKIVFNLLSNAFKYTPNGKMITMFIREDEKTVSIGVQDQGIGIAENKKKSLFVRFENLVDKNLFNQASTGIGLSLVKELVEMMTKNKAWLNMTWSGDAIWAIEEANAVGVDLDYVVPEEGSNIWYDGWVIPKYAKNPKAASYFINFMCRPDIALRNMDFCGYVSSVATPEILEEKQDTTLTYFSDLSYFFGLDADSIQLDKIQYPDRKVVERCAMIRDFGDKTKDVLEIWSRIKGDNLGVGITILIFVVVGVMSGWMIYKRVQRYQRNKLQRRRSRIRRSLNH